jgi:hypothetical protein
MVRALDQRPAVRVCEPLGPRPTSQPTMRATSRAWVWTFSAAAKNPRQRLWRALRSGQRFDFASLWVFDLHYCNQRCLPLPRYEPSVLPPHPRAALTSSPSAPSASASACPPAGQLPAGVHPGAPSEQQKVQGVGSLAQRYHVDQPTEDPDKAKGELG